jgi:hypothetical protein
LNVHENCYERNQEANSGKKRDGDKLVIPGFSDKDEGAGTGM